MYNTVHMTDTSSSAGPFNLGKLLFFFLLLIIILGSISLIGMVSYRMGISQSPASKLTPTPEIILSPTLTVQPTTQTSIPTTTSMPVSTLIPTSSLTSLPSNTPMPTSIPTLTPTVAPAADLFISEYSFNHPPKQGEPFTVKIGLYNKGNKAATSFWWEWWATSTVRPCRNKIDSMSAKGGIIVNCTYTYQGWGTFATKAVIDADNEVAESNEGNNTKTQNIVPIQF